MQWVTKMQGNKNAGSLKLFKWDAGAVWNLCAVFLDKLDLTQMHWKGVHTSMTIVNTFFVKV